MHKPTEPSAIGVSLTVRTCLLFLSPCRNAKATQGRRFAACPASLLGSYFPVTQNSCHSALASADGEAPLLRSLVAGLARLAVGREPADLRDATGNWAMLADLAEAEGFFSAAWSLPSRNTATPGRPAW